MISPKKLIKLAKKWQNLAASKRKRISLPTASGVAKPEICNPSPIPEKVHFVIYTVDQKHFAIPLKYLKNNIIQELFKIAEYELGLPGARPMTLPSDAVFMEYAISLIHRRMSKV
ncbi:auxin-responsive protein SAUR62-like [Pistacia vera]|uniref:auxin-responsive protein SAUR62-like n=1 Tax=Pistacia vera TaxID=55513 RepID=UPI001262F59E|nr:auxin-responsive protein SAUR62-like [Pistacia vera]